MIIVTTLARYLAEDDPLTEATVTIIRRNGTSGDCGVSHFEEWGAISCGLIREIIITCQLAQLVGFRHNRADAAAKAVCLKEANSHCAVLTETAHSRPYLVIGETIFDLLFLSSIGIT